MRKNYILFKDNGKEPVLAGSFSSMKRAREAIKEDAGREAKECNRDSGYVPHIEMRPDGGILRLSGGRRISYRFIALQEDKVFSMVG